MDFFALIIALPATIAFVAAVFRPILVACAFGETRRIQLVDLFSLVALWQYALAFVMLMHHMHYERDQDGSIAFFAGPFFLVLMTGLWFGLVSTMSRLGVQRASKRFVAVGLAVPVGIVATLVFFVSTILVFVAWSNREAEIKYLATIWVLTTTTGVLCRAGLQWATRPEPARHVDGDSAE